MKVALIGHSVQSPQWQTRFIAELKKQCNKNFTDGGLFLAALQFSQAVPVSEVSLPNVAPEKLALFQYAHEQSICKDADLVVYLDENEDWSAAKINHMERLLERVPAMIVWIPEGISVTEPVSTKELESKIGLSIVHDTLVNMTTLAMYLLSDYALLPEEA